MNKSFIFTLVTFLFACSAQAVPFNFQQLIDTNNGTISGTLANGDSFLGNPSEAAFQSFSWNVSGIELMVSGSSTNDSTTYAYLDSGMAGLGVCKNSSGSNQCNPGNDGNVTVDESALKLKTMESYRERSPWWILGTSFGYEAFLLTLSVLIFSRRDF